MNNQNHPTTYRELNVAADERLISMAAGAALLLLGLLRLPLLVAALILSGGYLFYRGFTGHCFGYEWMGINKAAKRFMGQQTAEVSNVPPPSVARSDTVTETSWESFPASDPPASW